MVMFQWASNQIDPDPINMLWHYARGEMPCYLSKESNEVGWVKYSHRGVQYLDKVEFPRKERRYIFSPRFEIRYDTAFEEVLTGCADLGREGRTWISKELFTGYLNLHRLGHAHSYEAWQDGQLVGGAFGVQIGGFISCESMFHRVSNASKAAWGQTLLYLKERGFAWVDTNCVASHRVEYGEQWVAQWKFEEMLREAMQRPTCFAEDGRCAMLPWQIRLGLPVARVGEALGKRLRRRRAAVAAGVTSEVGRV